MDNIQIINFRRARDFSAKLNATFEFVRQNFKSLAKSLLYIVGPSIVLLGVFNGYYQKYALDLTRIFQGDTAFTNELFIVLGGMVVFGITTQLLLISVILEYVNLYNEKQTNIISVDEVWERTKKSIGKVAMSSFLFIMILAAVSLAIGILAAMIGDSSALIAFLFIILIPLAVYISIALSIFFNVMLHEKRSLSEFGNVFKRCLYLIKSKWWSTFGIAFISSILKGLMGVVFSVPMMILLVFSAVNIATGETEPQPLWYELSMIISSVIAMLGSSLLTSIPLIAITFQYFNLVELKDATGLMNEIDDLGTIDQEESSEETY